MNLREFWAAEAAKLRDTSELLSVNTSQSTPVTKKDGVSQDNINSDSTDSVSVCIVPVRWQNDFDFDFSKLETNAQAAAKANIKAIVMIAQAAQFTFDLFVEAYSTANAIEILKSKLENPKTKKIRKINFLVIASHGGYNKAFFETGDKTYLGPNYGDQYTSPNDILKDRGMQALAKMIDTNDCRVVLTACHAGNPNNGGVALLTTLSKLFKCNVYGNQSWGTPSGATNTEYLFTDWRYNHIKPVIQDWTRYTSAIVQASVRPRTNYPNGYAAAGQWTRCIYNKNGTTTIQTVYNASFMHNGIAYYDKK
jgi:hypothetical protein